MPILQHTTSFIIRIKNLWPKTLLEREALVMFFLTQKRLRSACNTNFCKI